MSLPGVSDLEVELTVWPKVVRTPAGRSDPLWAKVRQPSRSGEVSGRLIIQNVTQVDGVVLNNGAANI